MLWFTILWCYSMLKGMKSHFKSMVVYFVASTGVVLFSLQTSAENCDPDFVLSAYYAYEACEQGDFAACDDLQNVLDVNSSESLALRNKMKEQWLVKAGAKPPHVHPFESGNFVKYKLPNGQETVAEVQGVLGSTLGASSRLIGTNPLRGTMEIRNDARTITKISREEYDKIAAAAILKTVGFGAGASVTYDVGGELVTGVIQEVGGAAFDDAKEYIYVKTSQGLQKIPIQAIKKMSLKPLQGANVKRVLQVMGRFVKASAALTSLLGGPLVGALFDVILSPTEIACQEMITLLYSDLKPNCKQSQTTSISDYFKTLGLDEQKKLVRGSSHICESLIAFIKKKRPVPRAIDYSYSQLQCSRGSVSFQSPQSLFPEVMSPGHASGYIYELNRPTLNAKRQVLTAKPYNNCRYAEVCSGPSNSDSFRAEIEGGQVKWMSVNGQFVSPTTNASLYQSLLRQVYTLHRQSEMINNECIRQKNETLEKNDTIQ